MIVVSKFSTSFSFIVLTIFLVALGHNFLKIINLKSQIFAIKYFLLAGAVAMLLELAMFFLGIEVLSIALYILAASDRMNLKVMKQE
jgi:NADH-quinone oxidoreductase subunit N